MGTSSKDSVPLVEFYSFAASTFSFFVIAFLAMQFDTAWLTALLAVFSLCLQLMYTWKLFRARKRPVLATRPRCSRKITIPIHLPGILASWRLCVMALN